MGNGLDGSRLEGQMAVPLGTFKFLQFKESCVEIDRCFSYVRENEPIDPFIQIMMSGNGGVGVFRREQ